MYSYINAEADVRPTQQKTCIRQIQQRMSCELLANLASCLLTDTVVFEIVNSLMEIQKIVENEILVNRHKLQSQLMDRHSDEIMKLVAKNVGKDEFKKSKEELDISREEDMRQFDILAIQVFDDKVKEQQLVLERAGIPGFSRQDDPIEIQVQMHLLDFIIRSRRFIYE